MEISLFRAFAEEADDGLRLGERAVALADFEPFLALLDGGGAVRRVHDGDRPSAHAGLYWRSTENAKLWNVPPWTPPML